MYKTAVYTRVNCDMQKVTHLKQQRSPTMILLVILTINVDKTKVMATCKNKCCILQQRETATGGYIQIPRSPDH